MRFIKTIHLVVIFCIILLFKYLSAQSFSGTINHKNAIWFEIKTDTANDSVVGTYFYNSIGKEIKFVGTKIDSLIELTEFNDKHIVTGFFSLIFWGDSINGTWKKPNSKANYPVRLYKRDPARKLNAISNRLNMRELYGP